MIVHLFCLGCIERTIKAEILATCGAVSGPALYARSKIISTADKKTTRAILKRLPTGSASSSEKSIQDIHVI
jgi:predicted flavoprotein YhiN